jgi:hypothetical protein
MERIGNEFSGRVDDIAYLLEFFSDEFAKKEITSHEDYKISAAYADMIINSKTALGITYPSVRTDYQGYNVALSIPAVENFLELEVVAMFKVHKQGANSVMDNLACATDLGPMKSSFNWIDMKGAPEEALNKLLFQG